MVTSGNLHNSHTGYTLELNWIPLSGFPDPDHDLHDPTMTGLRPNKTILRKHTTETKSSNFN
jgi:hypothetical protein